MNAATPLGLYFHLPFCRTKCPYCDFFSCVPVTLAPPFFAEWGTLLDRELAETLRAYPKLADYPLVSCYFGGGTPSLFPPEWFAQRLEKVGALFSPEWDKVEITLEANPGDGLERAIEAYQTAGINRISLGVQSFSGPLLARLGRRHGPGENHRCLSALSNAGLRSWSLDLIYGLPGMTLPHWKEELDKALNWQPPHLSVYGLTLHEGTPFYAAAERGELALPDDETQRAMFLESRHRLQDGGYVHYEISNYALPGHFSRHNTLYWTDGAYVGLGPAAHSYWGGERRANPESLEKYKKALVGNHLPGTWEEKPSLRSRRGEMLMLALRRLEGADLATLETRLGAPMEELYGKELKLLQAEGWILLESDRLALTEEGMLFSDQVFEAFF